MASRIFLNPPKLNSGIQKFEHDTLKIDGKKFHRKHWENLVQFNSLHGDKYFRVLHNGIQFRQYVGVIQVGELVLEILPKADKDDTDEKWQDVLIKMLEVCKRLKPRTVGDAHVKRQPINLLEIYFEAFLKETELLIRHGLVKRYRKEGGNVKALRGKLDFAANIRHNLVHKERFYTVHQIYDVNHLLHQVLSCALEIVDQFTAGTWLGDLCKRVKMNFPEVKYIRPNAQLLDSIKLDRKTAGYERALELARLIILNYSPDISSGKEKMIALLFDMNQLWEEYIRVKLSGYLGDREDYELIQETKTFWGSNFLKPDLILKAKCQGKTETFIIDTKWKRPDRPSIQDLRQMYTYGRFWEAKRVMLLYPGNAGDSEHREFETYDYWTNENYTDAVPYPMKHCCTMGFVSVLKDNKQLDDEIGKHIMELMNSAIN